LAPVGFGRAAVGNEYHIFELLAASCSLLASLIVEKTRRSYGATDSEEGAKITIDSQEPL
jgi:hypothetical protein